ncbi:MAG: hypothetical protein ACXWDB_08020 [Aeromicrobium sp.]
MTKRHDCGTDFERALLEFGTHRELPANRRSAADAIARHATHRRTSVADVYWLEYDDDRIWPVIVNFADGSRCWVSWGWVNHYDSQVPGSEVQNVDWITWLPENRCKDGWTSPKGVVQERHCPCFPGLLQPIGSECSYCGEVIEP